MERKDHVSQFFKRRSFIACIFGLTPAQAGVPTLRGTDHVGITVPDMEQAISFFEDVIGCKALVRFGPFRDDKGTFMQDLLDVDPRAVIKQITLLRCGHGSNIELFEYEAPDQNKKPARNSDYAGRHIAFYVEDIDAAIAYMKEKGVTTFLGPLKVDQGPAAGQSIVYTKTPWGLYVELISYPNGMAYEKDGQGTLWTPKAPAD